MPDSLIIKAAQYAAKKHDGQKRKDTDDPYIVHPLRVGGRMAMHRLATPEIVAAAFLHDVLEDTDATDADIVKRFGMEVFKIVEALTNPSTSGDHMNKPRDERKRIDREHLRDAPKHVKVIKLLDRIDNLRDMTNASPGWKKKYAHESLLLGDEIGDADEGLYFELVRLIRKLERA